MSRWATRALDSGEDFMARTPEKQKSQPHRIPTK
jgi:hypothetical protein